MAKTVGFYQRCFRSVASRARDLSRRGRATRRYLAGGVNSDASAKRLGKGPDRPLNTATDRAALLAALGCVTAVIIFDEDTPVEIIATLRPDIIVKGGDYEMQVLPETKLVESWGGKAIAIPFEFKRSTTTLVEKIRRV